jgi:Glycosyl hydrolase family 99
MVPRRLHFSQKLKIDPTRMSIDRLIQTIMLWVGFSLMLTLVTWCTPRPSGLTKLSTESLPQAASQPMTDTPDNSVPLLAYYYIWFDTQSWDRAKRDYPLLGRYSSDDADVMHRHIQWAKAAGIDGFIVSWKGTEKLNRRLAQLVQIAEAENFKLAINYEGLDFNRNPLPPKQVEADLDYFVQHYANNPVFDLFKKPLVIWAGTWEFSLAEIENVTQTKRNDLLILASEKNVEGYQRLSEFVDGDAYYWSSVNPDRHSGHLDKLTAMGETIHKNGGMWIAPAAPGFDARLVGGTSVVERKEGQTLKTELNTALQSLPDAVGLISWNEFSENSHIEPSQNYGNLYLNVLAETRLIALTTPK